MKHWFGKSPRKPDWTNKKGETVDGKWSYALQISVSRVIEFDKCFRKWFFKKIVKCKEPYTGATQFGIAIHQVAERYLGGLDGDDMYPKDWWKVFDDYGNHAGDLTTEEQRVLKTLIDRAITEGVLVRHPEGHIEWKFEDEIIPGVIFEGAIDYAYDFSIEDHKSCKNFKWTKLPDPKSSRYLGLDPQCLIYMYYWCEYQKSKGLEIPETVMLYHNQYCKEEKVVKKVPAEVPYRDCVSAYQKLQHSAQKMLNHKKNYKPESWEKVSTCDRSKRDSGCYYCKYKDMCDMNETVDMYKDRYERNELEKQRNKELRDKSMSFKGFKKPAAGNAKQKDVVEQLQEQIKDGSQEKVVEKEVRSIEQIEKDIADLTTVLESNELPLEGKKWNELQEELKCANKKLLEEAKAEKDAADKKAEEPAPEVKEVKSVDASTASVSLVKSDENPIVKSEKVAELTAKVNVKVDIEVDTDSKVGKVTEDKHFSKKDPILCIGCKPLATAKTKSIQSMLAEFTQAITDRTGEDYYTLGVWPRRAQVRHDIIEAFNAGHLNNLTIVAYGAGPEEQEAINALIAAGIFVYIN
mgnify:CR=1 FL=1|tara:strand:- start:64830 stop:66563 length:1734 start_codon:yes stop_codon:yes gene_type:complete